jgi:hypothetical protein
MLLGRPAVARKPAPQHSVHLMRPDTMRWGVTWVMRQANTWTRHMYACTYSSDPPAGLRSHVGSIRNAEICCSSAPLLVGNRSCAMQELSGDLGDSTQA